MLAVTVTITMRSICSSSSYCDNNDNNGRYICSANNYFDMGRYMCRANSYCDNNG